MFSINSRTTHDHRRGRPKSRVSYYLSETIGTRPRTLPPMNLMFNVVRGPVAGTHTHTHPEDLGGPSTSGERIESEDRRRLRPEKEKWPRPPTSTPSSAPEGLKVLRLRRKSPGVPTPAAPRRGRGVTGEVWGRAGGSEGREETALGERERRRVRGPVRVALGPLLWWGVGAATAAPSADLLSRVEVGVVEGPEGSESGRVLRPIPPYLTAQDYTPLQPRFLDQGPYRQTAQISPSLTPGPKGARSLLPQTSSPRGQPLSPPRRSRPPPGANFPCAETPRPNGG